MLASPQEASSGGNQRLAGWEKSCKWVPGSSSGISGGGLGQSHSCRGRRVFWESVGFKWTLKDERDYTGREERGEGRAEAWRPEGV